MEEKKEIEKIEIRKDFLKKFDELNKEFLIPKEKIKKLLYEGISFEKLMEIIYEEIEEIKKEFKNKKILDENEIDEIESLARNYYSF